MAQYVKYRIPFRDVNNQQYRVDIYGEAAIPTPATITLLAGANPLTIDEDDSKDFFAPVRTQTGNFTVCTKIEPQTAMPNGGILDIADIMPSNNTERPVEVDKWDETYQIWVPIWLGYLSCESYNQAYTTIPENIQLPVNSVLEAWKSMYYSGNAKIVSVGDLLDEIIHETYYHQQLLQVVKPTDGADLWTSLINTSIFVNKVDYQDEESTLYKIKGSSFYDILTSICKFMGWVARESGHSIYLQQMQGYGVLANTETRQMEALPWRGTNHQRSIVSGAKTVQVTANLEEMDVNIELPELPFSNLLPSQENVIDPGHQVYILPSTDTEAFSNIIFRQCAGDIIIGGDASTYSFQDVQEDFTMEDLVENSIPYSNANSQAVLAKAHPYNTQRLYAGAFHARIQIDDPQDHDIQHRDAKDGIYLSLFPNAYGLTNAEPILEINDVQAFAAFEEGYLNLQALFHTFWDMPAVDASGDNCRYMFELQVGNRYWNGSDWQTQPAQFFPENDVVEPTKFVGNWDASMDIEEVDGICIPTFFTENGVIKHIMGQVTLRIYPATRRYTTVGIWQNLVQGVFFEQLDIVYIPKTSVERTDRSNNVFFKDLGTAFSDEKSMDNNLASWLHNNPSPSLLYKSDGSEPLQKLTYKNALSADIQARPESVVLNRMATYYSQPRTILNLEVQHIDDKPLPLLLYNGLGDGKVYAPMSTSRDFQEDTSTINFMEVPQ